MPNVLQQRRHVEILVLLIIWVAGIVPDGHNNDEPKLVRFEGTLRLSIFRDRAQEVGPLDPTVGLGLSTDSPYRSDLSKFYIGLNGHLLHSTFSTVVTANPSGLSWNNIISTK